MNSEALSSVSVVDDALPWPFFATVKATELLFGFVPQAGMRDLCYLFKESYQKWK